MRRTELSYYLFSALTCAVDMFHLFIDYVDLCFSCRNRKCVYFAHTLRNALQLLKYELSRDGVRVNTDLLVQQMYYELHRTYFS